MKARPTYVNDRRHPRIYIFYVICKVDYIYVSVKCLTQPLTARIAKEEMIHL